MGFPISEAYSLSVNAKSLVGSVMANLCGSHYPLHMAVLEVSSQRILIEKSLLGTQVRTTGSNVAPFTQTAEEDPGNCTKATKR